jgi:hypothetical protein
MSVDIIDNTEAIDQFWTKENKRARFDLAQQGAKKKAVIGETLKLQKKGHDVCLPSGEPLRFPVDNATAKRLRRSDRQQGRQQSRDAARDGGDTIVTGNKRVQRANIRSLALGA